MHPAVFRLLVAIMATPDAFFSRVRPESWARWGGMQRHVHAVSRSPWRLVTQSAKDWAWENRN